MYDEREEITKEKEESDTFFSRPKKRPAKNMLIRSPNLERETKFR